MFGKKVQNLLQLLRQGKRITSRKVTLSGEEDVGTVAYEGESVRSSSTPFEPSLKTIGSTSI